MICNHIGCICLVLFSCADWSLAEKVCFFEERRCRGLSGQIYKAEGTFLTSIGGLSSPLSSCLTFNDLYQVEQIRNQWNKITQRKTATLLVWNKSHQIWIFTDCKNTLIWISHFVKVEVAQKQKLCIFKQNICQQTDTAPKGLSDVLIQCCLNTMVQCFNLQYISLGW